jgi:hypothetical protein
MKFNKRRLTLDIDDNEGNTIRYRAIELEIDGKIVYAILFGEVLQIADMLALRDRAIIYEMLKSQEYKWHPDAGTAIRHFQEMMWKEYPWLRKVHVHCAGFLCVPDNPPVSTGN